MIKTFCDWCEVEITRNYIGRRIKGCGYIRGENAALIEIMAGKHPTWNSGHICHSCLRVAVLYAIDNDLSE